MYYLDEQEIEALRTLFQKKKLFRYQGSGPSECELFESEFSAYLGTQHSLLLNSGTNALLLSLLSGGIQPGDEVLIPSYTFVATAAAVVMAGAIPIIVNIDSQLSMDMAEAESKITDKTKAIILVHMDGLAANVEQTIALSQKHKLIFIEDAAQAIGGSFREQKLGFYGDFGCFSLNESKNISCGEGGILTTSHKPFFDTAFILHDTPVQFSPTKKESLAGVKTFIGHSMRVSEIQGVIMRSQLSRLEEILSELRKRKKIIIDTVLGSSSVSIPTGYCPQGDCGASIHLQFETPDKALLLAKKLRDLGLLFAPVTSRPAHASWKWVSLFGDKGNIQSARNPFLTPEKKYSYSTADQLVSVDILSRTVKMDIDIHSSLDQTKEKAMQIAKVIAHG